MEKNSSWPSCGICALMIVLLAVFSVSSGMAQVSQSCLNNLGPCLNNLNWTNQPDICCEPLKELINMGSECLCSLISNQGAMQEQFMGINVTQLAQELTGRCGQSVNPLACLTRKLSIPFLSKPNPSSSLKLYRKLLLPRRLPSFYYNPSRPLKLTNAL
ncbi:hypothetical protein CRG98_027090 [Punica granatum]|uniref:Bifunctional inhibitor/plant lipid transfer protein/seed storage helical domain-containing protein n=1 Tax=Punica granatum TaxID=22663 RepID=A0A2I0J8F6_PUNGR|nr:hypothetical protein CRG98_027090 [Punica granatum]